MKYVIKVLRVNRHTSICFMLYTIFYCYESNNKYLFLCTTNDVHDATKFDTRQNAIDALNDLTYINNVDSGTHVYYGRIAACSM